MNFTMSTYNRGDALADVIAIKEVIVNGSDRKTAGTFTSNVIVEEFHHYKQYHVWAAFLCKHARDLIEALDEMQLMVNQAGDSFYHRRCTIKWIINDLETYHNSVRNLEYDIDEFINAYTVTDINQKINEISSVQGFANKIEASYSQVNSSARSKLDTISRSRVTATNILISVSALIVAIISIFKTK